MNNSELFYFLPSMIDDERSLAYSSPWYVTIYHSIVQLLSGICGTFMKLFLVYNMTKEKISERPINILIIIDQTVDFVGNSVLIISALIHVSKILSSFKQTIYAKIKFTFNARKNNREATI